LSDLSEHRNEYDWAEPNPVAAREASTGEQDDECVKRWHDRAVSAGEERILARTVNGGLHSYRAEEITLYRQGNRWYAVGQLPTSNIWTEMHPDCRARQRTMMMLNSC
jgi:hypothetical protein